MINRARTGFELLAALNASRDSQQDQIINLEGLALPLQRCCALQPIGLPQQTAPGLPPSPSLGWHGCAGPPASTPVPALPEFAKEGAKQQA